MDIAAVAAVAHEANRALQVITGDPAPSPPWADAPEWQRTAAASSVQAALRGVTPAQLHDDWAREKIERGWRHGPLKDAEAKTHPCLVPYDELPAEQKAKDALFLGIVRALAGELSDLPFEEEGAVPRTE